MKRNSLITGVLFVMGFCCSMAQEINQKSTDANGREKLLGIINEEGLKQGSFGQWYKPLYTNYEVDTESINSIKKQLHKYEILAFMGTWCGDSKREVPRFYKILNEVGYPTNKLTMVAVDNTRESYKKSPTGEEKGYDIIKVPTFIVLKNGKEVNRIVESPKVSLEKDLKAIILKQTYIPNYKIVPVD